jgi:hypothetical protein
VKPCTGQGLCRGHVLVRGQTVSDRVLVRGSVGVVYWSGVTPCTGQGLLYGVVYWSGVKPCTGQGLRRGHVLVRGQTVVRGCIYIRHMCGCIYIYIYIHTHTHSYTHTHIHRRVFFLSPRMYPHGLTRLAAYASSQARFALVARFLSGLTDVMLKMSANEPQTVGISSASFVSPKCQRIE